MTDRPAAPDDASRTPAPRRTGVPALLAVAMVCFGLGILALVVIFAVLLISNTTPSLWLYFAAMLSPLGFLLGLIYALSSGRRARTGR